MIDIWMLFTMTVPFLEVVLHTMNEVFKNSRSTPICLNKQVNVVNIKPAEEEDQQVVEEVKNCNNNLSLVTSLMLPVSSLIFAFVFWTIGLFASYSDGNHKYPNLTECLAIQPN